MHKTWRAILGAETYTQEVKDSWEAVFTYVLTTVSDGYLEAMKDRPTSD